MAGSNIVSYILIGLLLAGMVILMLVQGRRQKKAQEDYLGMLDTLRPGVKVKMASGLLGRITEIREEAPGFKTVTLNVGDHKNPIEMTFVIEAVQGIVNEEIINKLNAEKTLAEGVNKQTEVSSVENVNISVENKAEDVKAENVSITKTAAKKKTVNKSK